MTTFLCLFIDKTLSAKTDEIDLPCKPFLSLSVNPLFLLLINGELQVAYELIQVCNAFCGLNLLICL